jgi:hypothetical protein
MQTINQSIITTGETCSGCRRERYLSNNASIESHVHTKSERHWPQIIYRRTFRHFPRSRRSSAYFCHSNIRGGHRKQKSMRLTGWHKIARQLNRAIGGPLSEISMGAVKPPDETFSLIFDRTAPVSPQLLSSVHRLYSTQIERPRLIAGTSASNIIFVSHSCQIGYISML